MQRRPDHGAGPGATEVLRGAAARAHAGAAERASLTPCADRRPPHPQPPWPPTPSQNRRDPSARARVRAGPRGLDVLADACGARPSPRPRPSVSSSAGGRTTWIGPDSAKASAHSDFEDLARLVRVGRDQLLGLGVGGDGRAGAQQRLVGGLLGEPDGDEADHRGGHQVERGDVVGPAEAAALCPDDQRLRDQRGGTAEGDTAKLKAIASGRSGRPSGTAPAASRASSRRSRPEHGRETSPASDAARLPSASAGTPGTTARASPRSRRRHGAAADAVGEPPEERMHDHHQHHDHDASSSSDARGVVVPERVSVR